VGRTQASIGPRLIGPALYKRVIAAGIRVTVLVAVALFFMSVKP
jgi:hypothetical protein